MKRYYFDSAATTPLLPKASQAMEPWLMGGWGNPSSLHAEGRAAKEAIDKARAICSEAFGCLFGEFHFTSGGTESCNWGVIGGALAAEPGRSEIVFGAAEHHAVLHTQKWLERLGFRVHLVRCESEAQVDLSHLSDLVNEKTALVSLMHANNETGRFNPILDVSKIVKNRGALLHVDAVQTFPHVKAADLEADLVSCSAHKFGGPKGAGGLWIRAGIKPAPLMVGGGQEREMRAGTENTAAIVGMGEAVNQQILNPQWQRAKSAARSAFWAQIEGMDAMRLTCPGLILHEKDFLPGHLHVITPLLAERVLIRLDHAGISASSGAACSSGSLEPSHVLLACGASDQEAKCGLRFSFGQEISAASAQKGGRIFREEFEQMLSLQSGQQSPNF